MSLSLFTTPLRSITADDVNAFLDLEIEEGTRVDYKQADTRSRTGVPDTLFRALTAYANTYGGVVILGVATDANTNRPGKRDGIPLRSSLEEAITSKCYSLIYPPLVPDVCVCPFKSDPALSTNDRAFVVVRVSSSPARPHFIDNRVLVRLNSECRDADPMTLRMLFDYQQQQERRAEAMGSEAESGIESVHQRFASELTDEQKKQRWAPGSNRITVEFIPLDAPTDLFPFWDTSQNDQPLDNHVLELLQASAWYVQGMEASDVVRTPRGLGIVAVGLRLNAFRQRIETNASVVDIVYLDGSGALALDIATLSIGLKRPREDGADSIGFPEQLLKRIARAMKVLWQLYQEKGYSGRVQVNIWADAGSGMPSFRLKAEGNRGTTILNVLDEFDERGNQLGTMVSQMTRSWLGFNVSVKSWSGDTPLFA